MIIQSISRNYLFTLFFVTYAYGIDTDLRRATQINKLNNPVNVSFSPNGKYFSITNAAAFQLILTDAILTQRNGQVNIYRTDGCKIKNTCKPLGIFQLIQPIKTIFSPDNSCVAVASIGQILGLPGAVLFYKIKRCSLDFSFILLDAVRPTAIAFSPDGSCFAVADTLHQGRVLLYKTGNCQIINQYNPSVHNCFGIEALDIAFSPDGSLLAISDISTGKVTLLEVKDCAFTKKTYSIKKLCRPSALAFSPDGDFLAVSEYIPYGRVIIYKIKMGIAKKISQLGKLCKPSTLSFSRDGTKLAIGQYGNGETDIHAIHNGIIDTTPSNTITSGCFGVSSVTFSPVDNCLAIAQEVKNTVSMFDIT